MFSALQNGPGARQTPFASIFRRAASIDAQGARQGRSRARQATVAPATARGPEIWSTKKRRAARKKRSRAGAARTGAGDGSASRPWTTPAPGARGAVNATNADRGAKAVRERDASPERGARERGPRGPAPATAPPRVCGQPPLLALAALSKGVAHSRARRRLGRRPIQFERTVSGVDATNADRGTKSRAKNATRRQKEALASGGREDRRRRRLRLASVDNPRTRRSRRSPRGLPTAVRAGACAAGRSVQRTVSELTRRTLIAGRRAVRERDAPPERGARERGPRGPAPATAPPRVCGQPPLPALAALSKGVAHSRARRRLGRRPISSKNCFGVDATNADRGTKSRARTRRAARKRRSRAGAARTGAGDGSASRLWTTPAPGARGALQGGCPQPCAPAPVPQADQFKELFGVDATNADRGAKSRARTRRAARKRRSRAGAARTGAGDGSASRLWTTPAPGARGALQGGCPQPCAPAPGPQADQFKELFRS